MRSHIFSRLARFAAAVVLLGATASVAGAAGPEPGAPARRSANGFSLYADVFTVFLVNRVACGINNLGEVCVDPGNSPIGGGGFWPKGTPDQYIFNSGVQVAGIIPGAAGFAWAGDTVGAFFMDPRGTQQQGDGVTLVFNSLTPEDVANWPTGAIARDTSLFHPTLIGRSVISQQDLWTRAWDGNPNLLSGRTHPMGVLVETRGMAWNFPSGNEDILYFLYTIYNVTASDPAAYAGLDPAIQAEIAEVGAQFQSLNESTLEVDIPDAGYAIEEVYAAFFMDPDVEDASHNYSTAVLPFQLAVAYKHNFQAPLWGPASEAFPPEIFGPPFAAAPGFVGVKYLKSPLDPVTGEEVGLTIFSNTNNASTGFPDPVGVLQLWRYLSGNVSPAAGDNPCTVNNPQQRQLCYLEQEDLDTRFYQSSGPFTLEPGQSATIVVAYVHAAPVASAVTPFIGGDMKPGIPGSGSRLAAGIDTLRNIDRAVGWVGPATDVDGDGVVEQGEVQTLPRSLLDKSLVAQAVFDAKFLLPFAPAPPNFFLVPGDNQVTIVWEPSATETVGDPFASVAGDATSPLFDPNFRAVDVEGYRLYRGRTPSALEMIGQFDYIGTTFVDATGALGSYGNCAPELGVTTDCPTFPNAVELEGNLIQVPPGGRVVLADDATVIVLNADTAVTGGGASFPPLTNTGVPFAFVDNGVLNSFTYFYSVTAFDVNSIASGPTSLESPLISQSVTPRAPAGNAVATVFTNTVTGDDDSTLSRAGTWPAIDPADGTFNGNVPPITSGNLEFLAAVVEALPAGDITVRIDSVTGGFAGGFGPGPDVHFTLSAGDVTQTRSVSVGNMPNFSASAGSTYEFSQPLVPYDSAQSALVGLTFSDTSVRMPVQFTGTSVPMAWSSPSVATASGRYGVPGFEAARYLGHSRWFDEGGSEPPDPTIVGYADSANHAGTLTGVGRIWSPAAYRVATTDINPFLRGFNAAAMAVWYPADFVITWGAGGTVTVRDVTHNVTLPATTAQHSGHGFLNISNILATGITQTTFDQEFDLSGSGAFNIINYQHLFMIEPTCSDYWGVVAFPCATLESTAELSPLDFDNDGTQDAMGIVLVINGEPFMMEMTSLPAAGTAWHLRAITGQFTATCTPALDAVMTDCADYGFTPNPFAPTVVPGLQYNITVTQQFAIDAGAQVDLEAVHTVPDPYYVTNPLEISPNRKVLRFVNLPNQAIIRIYSVSGVLVDIVEHNSSTGGGEVTWDLRNRNDQFVASGVYFYHVETPTGQEKVGRFTVVNFAQ